MAKSENQSQEKLLSAEQVDAVLQFSQALYALDQSQLGLWSPQLSNALLQNLNNSGMSFDMQKLSKALADYRAQGQTLQDYTEFMKRQDEIFSRTLDYYGNILAFDLQIIPTNVYSDGEYKSEEYQKDKQAIYKFLDSFDYKAEFRRVVRELLTHEVYYVWFRRTKWGNADAMKGTLQILPQTYCMLTGYWEKGLLFSFDMSYFLQAGVDIDGYDPQFKTYYKNVFDRMGVGDNFKPAAALKQQNGTYAFWTQTSPEDGAWAFKFDLGNFNTTPHFAPLLRSALQNELVASLQYNKDIAGAYNILVGDIRLFDNAKSGTTANQFAIDPGTLGGFMRKVKQGLPKEFVAVAMPTEGSKLYHYEDANTDASINQNKIAGGASASASRLIYATDRMSTTELENAIQVDGNLVKGLYSQFQNFLEFWANKRTKKYKFKFLFEGLNFEFERNKRVERLFKFADKGIVLNSSAFASAMGMAPQDFDRSLSEGHSGDFVSKLTMLMNVNTMKNGGGIQPSTSSDSQGGRPPVDSSTLSDSGEQNRNQ